MMSFLGDKYRQIIVTKNGMRYQLGKNVLHYMINNAYNDSCSRLRIWF